MDQLRERMAAFGATVLSDVEILSLLLSSDDNRAVSQRVLAAVGCPGGLLTRRISELSSIPGMGRRRAERLMAALELGRRASCTLDPGRPLMSSADVAEHLSHLRTEPVEIFMAVAVNARNRVTGEWVIARGWESGVNLTPRQVMTLLVKEGAGRVIMVHNHPSGDPAPSPEDVRFTQRLLEAARTLDIRILDHVIVASGGFASMRETAREEAEFG